MRLTTFKKIICVGSFMTILVMAASVSAKADSIILDDIEIVEDSIAVEEDEVIYSEVGSINEELAIEEIISVDEQEMVNEDGATDTIKIELSPKPITVALGGSVRVKVEASDSVDRSKLVIEKGTHYDADWADETRKEIIVTGLVVTSSSQYDVIQVVTEGDETGPRSIKIPVYVEKVNITYSLVDPTPEITVKVGGTAMINFDDIIYDYQGFAPTDDLEWIIPSAYSEIATLVPNGKGKDVTVKGLKKGEAFVFLKVNKGENKVFPQSSDVKNYYVKIKVKDVYTGNPSYTYYDGATLKVEVGKKQEIDFDLIVSDCINWSTEDCEYSWKIPSQYSNIAKIEQSDKFEVKGLKDGNAYAYLEIKTDAGKFPKTSTIEQKYLLPIVVGKGGSSEAPTSVPTASPTKAPSGGQSGTGDTSGGAWYSQGNVWKWKYSNGSFATNKWVSINGKWYYFGAGGSMQTGWIKTGGKWYYLTRSGAMATGWIKDGGKWYYLTGSGAMATGWIKDGGKWYYLTGSGAMATGWIKNGGKWYYLTGSGAMATGWIKSGGKDYYLYSDGHMAANEWIGKYHVNGNGAWDATR